jgi:hypothetical protein
LFVNTRKRLFALFTPKRRRISLDRLPSLPAGHAFFHGEEPKDELKSGMVISIM